MSNDSSEASTENNETTPQASSRFGNTIIRFKWFVPFFVLAVVVALGSGLGGLYFSTNYRAFFGPDNPQLNAFERMQNIYAKDDNVLIMVESKEDTVFNASTLTAIQELSELSWQIPYSTRVDSLTNYQHSIGTADELIVDDLVPAQSPLDRADLKRIEEVALHEPLLVHRLLSPDGKATAVNITVELPGVDAQEVPEVAQYVRGMTAEFLKTHPDLTISLSGLVMLNNAFPEASIADMSTLTMAMYGLIMVLTFVFTRSIVGTIGTFAVIGLSTIGAMGVAGFLEIGLTPISVMAPTVIMTLAVADCVHIIVTYRQALAQGKHKYDAIRESLRVNIGPVFVTSLTTAIGFLSLSFSDTPPFQHYGLITAVGVMLAFAFSTTILPAILAILPARAPKQVEHKSDRFAAAARWLIAHRYKNLAAVAVVAVILSASIPLIDLDDRFVQYFDKTVEFRNHTDHINKTLTGVYNVSYDLESGTENGITDPAYLERLEAFTLWLRDQPEVVHVSSLSDIYKRINKNMNNDQASFYRIPENKELASQYLLLYEMSLPFGLDLTTLTNVKKSGSKVTATLQDMSTTEIRGFEERSNAWIAANNNDVFAGTGASPAVMFAHISQRNIDAMIGGTIFSLILITLVLVIALRSVRIGLLSLAPNIIPILMGFGFWALLVGSIGMAVATVAGLTLGIVVDDTVHVISKYLRARREGRSPEESIEYSYSAVGRALVITSVILICGFMIMSQSTFRMNWSLGLLSSITIFSALIADMLMLPGLLIGGERLFAKNKARLTGQHPVIPAKISPTTNSSTNPTDSQRIPA